jgi:KDO2-lipid IV(A) lauroyltransferase
MTTKSSAGQTPLREHIEYLLVMAVLHASRLLPERLIFWAFRRVAILVFHFSARRRKLALENIASAFPEKSEQERRSIIRQSFLHIAETMATSLLISTNRISKERLIGMVEIENPKPFQALADHPAPAPVVLSAHFGNWEILPQYVALKTGKKAFVVARKGNNALLEDHVIRPSRERLGVHILYKKNALMRLIKASRNGDLSGLLIDQKLRSKKESVVVNFFGRPAPSTPAPAMLQIKFGIPALSAFMVREGRNRYRLHVGEFIEWNGNGAEQDEQIRALTQIHQDQIEEMIRRYPEQWFWIHNRWDLPHHRKQRKKRRRR